MKSLARPLLYLWALPTTSVGLIATLLTLLTGGRAKLHTGVLEAHGGFATFLLKRLVPLAGGASAMTLGHVVIARDRASHDRTRAHERVTSASANAGAPSSSPPTSWPAPTSN